MKTYQNIQQVNKGANLVFSVFISIMAVCAILVVIFANVDTLM